MQEFFGGAEGGQAADQQAGVQHIQVQDGGDIAVLEAAEAGDKVVRFRGYGDDFDLGVVFAQAAANAH